MFSKIFQFSLFQCLKDAFVLLTFQFQVYSTLGKQLSFFRAKISGFAFSPTSKRSLQVCVIHIPFSRAARKGQSPMTLHCNCTGAMQSVRQQKPRYVLVQKRIPELFFVKADVLFWKRSSFVYLEESVRVPLFVPSPLRHRCRSWRLMFLKSVNRQPDYPTLKNDSHEAWKCSVTRKKYFERPHRCSDGSGWEQHPALPNFLNRTIVLAPNVVVFFFDQYANTLIGSCNGLRSYQPTSCGCQGSVFLEWTIVSEVTCLKTTAPRLLHVGAPSSCTGFLLFLWRTYRCLSSKWNRYSKLDSFQFFFFWRCAICDFLSETSATPTPASKCVMFRKKLRTYIYNYEMLPNQLQASKKL